METQEAGRLGIEIVNASRRWAHAREVCRRYFDSKSAPPAEVEKAKRAYMKASDELEAHVRKLEVLMRLSGLVVPMGKRPKTTKPFPWKRIAIGITKAVEDAINKDDTSPPIEAEVVDVTPK